MSCRSQYLVSRNVPQRVDGGEGSAGTVRRYELIALFGFAGDLPVYLVVDMHFFEEVLTDMAKQFMQIGIVVIYVARIWRMVVVLLQDSEGDTAVDAQRVDRNEALVARLLLNYRELPVSKILRTYAHQV